MKKNIVLIGFMGVGKGTIARAIAKQSAIFAVDTDDLIESMENRTIKEIFAKEGEDYFRRLEQKCADWIEKNLDNTLISTGGGFFKRPNLQKLGTVVYLESSFKGIMKRIHEAPNVKKKLKKRPLLQDMKKAKTLFNERILAYQSVANVTINVENKPLDLIVQEILQKVNYENT